MYSMSIAHESGIVQERKKADLFSPGLLSFVCLRKYEVAFLTE
jgi:hypothetical protein